MSPAPGFISLCQATIVSFHIDKRRNLTIGDKLVEDLIPFELRNGFLFDLKVSKRKCGK